MTTGLRASTFENLQLNAGMFLANFDYSTATDAATLGALLKTEREKTSGSALIGATRGGGTFVCTPNTRSIEADGKREEWKGSSVNDGWTIKLTTTLLEINATNLKRSFGTADVTDTEKKHTIKIRTDIKDADYIESLVWVGDTSKGYVLIAIKNALNTAGRTRARALSRLSLPRIRTGWKPTDMRLVRSFSSTPPPNNTRQGSRPAALS